MSSRHNIPASASKMSGYATPSARSHGANDGGGRRSFLPRPSGLGGGGSIRKSNATGTSGGPVQLRRRSSVDDMALKARLSAAGRGGNSRLSVLGGVGGCGGSGASSNAMLKVTPIRKVLSAVNYSQPLSVQSKRMSSASRQSNAGRHKRKEVRPINDSAFKKHCVDNILNFLSDNHYCNQDSSLLNRRVITSPTNKDFANIFMFIYGILVSNYKLPSRFDEEIPTKLKLLVYHSQIPKSTFASVGSPHSWPTLLAMLSWLCDIVNCTVLMTSVQEMAYPSDFENAVNPNWEALSVYLEAMRDPDPNYQMKYLESYKDMLEQERGLSSQQIRQLEEEVSSVKLEEQQLKQSQSELPALRHSNTELRCDIGKLEDFNRSMKMRIDQLQEEEKRLQQEVDGLHSRKQRIKEDADRLSTLKASQNFSPEELLRIKNHQQTTAVSLQQLQDQGKQTQEKMWAVEMRLCKSQVLRSELIQQYNTSPAASLVGALTAVHHPSEELMDTSDSNAPASGVGVTVPVQEKDLQELSKTLSEELRVTRAKVVQAHAARSKMEEQYRSVELQVEERKLEKSQLERRISSLEEDIGFLHQEKKNEESAMLEQLSVVQQEVSAARRVPKPQLYTRQQHLSTLNQEFELRKHNLMRKAEVGVASVEKMCLKIDELLEFEINIARTFEENVARIIENTGDKG